AAGVQQRRLVALALEVTARDGAPDRFAQRAVQVGERRRYRAALGEGHGEERGGDLGEGGGDDRAGHLKHARLCTPRRRRPSPPTGAAAASERRSPFRFGAAITEYSSGRSTSCANIASVMRSLITTRPPSPVPRPRSLSGTVVSPNRSLAISYPHSRNPPSVNFMMLPLCTSVTEPRPALSP